MQQELFRARFFAHGLSSACAKHQALEQRIAGQAIGPVHAGTSSLARGIKAGERCATVQIGAHAAHAVMRRRAHGDQVGSDVNVVAHAGSVYARKSLAHPVSVEMRKVEIDHRILGSADFQLVNDGARHHIARRQLVHGVVTVHEAVQFHVAQVGAFAA